MANFELNCGGKSLALSDHIVIMGILNVTPDSFSDGGNWLEPQRAVEHALQMVADGAEIIDIGGESTRPGSAAVSAKEQIKRTAGIIEKLAQRVDVPISIDTTSCEVARAALQSGATIINDISALRFDEEMADLAAEAGCPVVLMHMQGTPGNMQAEPRYDDVVNEVKEFLAERVAFAVGRGIKAEQLLIDPGIGFGKKVEHNYSLMRHLEDFAELGRAILVGASRKAFIGKTLGLDKPEDRLFGTAATVARCVAAGVQIVRVHDVKEMTQVARMAEAIEPKVSKGQ
ncbi:MAG: dihydropteroate synthase [Sedimentisphaerales bacterium]|nr:dihydropteroate synthase [Sedimentisphaerales bacterium]